MYKAVHIQTGEEIIILHPTWRKRIGELRAMDHADVLVCQGCRQPLRVKAGEVKRPHFAHKHLQACSYGSESPEILNARAVLYEWLLKEFCPSPGGDVQQFFVTVEKKVDGVALPRPVDAWVEMGPEGAGAIAYWIIEAGIKLEPRQAILAAFERLGVEVHFVFLQAMLNEKREEFHSLLLTPTERAFLQKTDFDLVPAGAAEAGNSLHYLDADGLVLTTYRNLVLHHSPNWYKGVKKTDKLRAVRARRTDGEFVHRGELEGLNKHRKRLAHLQEKRKRYAERETAWSQRVSRPGQDSGNRWMPEPETHQGSAAVELPLAEKPPWAETLPSADGLPGMERLPGAEKQPWAEPLPCVICGQITSEYWSTFTDSTGRRLCRCRECLERDLKSG